MKQSKKSLKQKLAMALSVVNALNVCAPIALPYVNVARNVRAEGGNTEPLSDNLARAFYGTAQAYTNPVENTSVVGQTVASGTQNVNEGGTTTYTSVNNGGVQNVNEGGYATFTSVNSGGVQNVNEGGTTTFTSVNNGGRQNVNDGGMTTCTYVNNGGVQNVLSGGTAYGTHVKSGGVQNVKSGGTADATIVSSGGKQAAEAGGILAGTQKIGTGGGCRT